MYDELPEEDNNIVKGTNMSQIATALDYMNKHYSESIKAGELSALCNMSETHFRRLFESIHQYAAYGVSESDKSTERRASL